MSQKKINSLFESITNVIVGYAINILANYYILPIFGYEVTLKKNLLLGLCFMGISLIRAFILRRIFNALDYGSKATPNSKRGK